MKRIFATTLALLMVSTAASAALPQQKMSSLAHYNKYYKNDDKVGHAPIKYGASSYGACKHMLGKNMGQPQFQTTPNPMSEQAKLGLKPGDHPLGSAPSCHSGLNKWRKNSAS